MLFIASEGKEKEFPSRAKNKLDIISQKKYQH